MISQGLILQESEVRSLACARYNKLLGVREHLKALINKKLRLEFEIKQLEKSLKNKQRASSRSLKLKVGLEDTQLMDLNTAQDLLEMSPDLINVIQRGDVLVQEITDLLESEGYISKEEQERLNLLL